MENRLFKWLTTPLVLIVILLAVSALSLCSIMAVLSWTTGRVVRYVAFEQHVAISAGLALKRDEIRLNRHRALGS